MGYLGNRHTAALRLCGAMGKGEAPPALLFLGRILNKNVGEHGVVAQPAAVQNSLTTGFDREFN